MTENKGKPAPSREPLDDEDVEGHSMMINPTLASDVARVRSKDIEREAQQRNRAKEAKR
jgi:hypothetical protein